MYSVDDVIVGGCGRRSGRNGGGRNYGSCGKGNVSCISGSDDGVRSVIFVLVVVVVVCVGCGSGWLW